MSDTSVPRRSGVDDAADHAVELLGRFGRWLDRQDEVAWPPVDHEVRVLTAQFDLARDHGADLSDAHGFDITMNLILDSLLSTPELKDPEAAQQALSTMAVLQDYASFQSETADDPSEWDAILDVFDRAFAGEEGAEDQNDAPGGSPSAPNTM